jgi:hypothetical protein
VVVRFCSGSYFSTLLGSTVVLVVPLLCCYCVYHPLRACFDGLAPSTLYCSSKIMDVLRNRSSRLEMVMHLLFVVDVNGGCKCYRVGGARSAQTH